MKRILYFSVFGVACFCAGIAIHTLLPVSDDRNRIADDFQQIQPSLPVVKDSIDLPGVNAGRFSTEEETPSNLDDSSENKALTAITEIEAIKQDVETLIQDFNENLDDPESRQIIKEKMKLSIEQYNEKVLPIVLEKMKLEQNNSF